MSTITINNASGSFQNQQLFSVAYTSSWRPGVAGVPYYVSPGNIVKVQFTPDNYNTINIDSGVDIKFSDFTNTEYFEMSAIVTSDVPGIKFQFGYSDQSSLFGPIVSSGERAVTQYLGGYQDMSLFAFLPEGMEFNYPNKINTATLEVTQIGSITVV